MTGGALCLHLVLSGPPPLSLFVSHQGMCDTFQQLCSDVDIATRFTHLFEDRRPHYQRVLDYILAHPEERDAIAASLSHSLTGEPGGARASIYLLQFLMESLHWPEVKAAAQEQFNDGGNAWYAHEIQQ